MNTKLLLFIGILFSFQVFAQNTNSYARYENEQSYLLADNVNIRSSPSTSANVIANLPIATKIIITEVSPVKLKLNGYQTNWLKIKFQQNGKMLEGYVWGGLVATEVKSAPQDEKLLFLYGIERYNKEEYDLILQIRVAKGNKQLAKCTAEAVGSLSTSNSLTVTENRGVEGVNNIIRIGMSDDMCAGAFGDIIAFWHNNALTYINTLVDGSDAPCFSEEEYIYPDDEGGEAGKIIWTNQSGCYDDDDYETPNLDVDEKVEYRWNGSKLVEI